MSIGEDDVAKAGDAGEGSDNGQVPGANRGWVPFRESDVLVDLEDCVGNGWGCWVVCLVCGLYLWSECVGRWQYRQGCIGWVWVQGWVLRWH